jgi:lipopolysaccharide export system permease protein
MKMKILDRYLVVQFLQTMFFGLLTFTLLFVVIDMMEKLGDILDHNVPNNMIFQYYFVFIPEIVRLMTPVAVLLASLFVAGKMSNLNELTAIKASGVSLYRFMIPFVITSFIISLASVYFGGYIVPEANKHKVFIEQNYLKKGIVFFGSNIFFQDSPSRIISINYYDVPAKTANQISIQEFDAKDNSRIIKRTDAFKMEFDSTKKVWICFDGATRIFTDSTETIEKFDIKVFSNLYIRPTDVLKKQRRSEEMTLSELDDFAAEQLRTGNNPTEIKIEYHSRIAYAFACIVVVLFGLPISANKRRGGLAIQFGFNLMITFAYLLFMKISQAYGKSGSLSPFITAWFANFIFLIAAIFNIRRAQK